MLVLKMNNVALEVWALPSSHGGKAGDSSQSSHGVVGGRAGHVRVPTVLEWDSS